MLEQSGFRLRRKRESGVVHIHCSSSKIGRFQLCAEAFLRVGVRRIIGALVLRLRRGIRCARGKVHCEFKRAVRVQVHLGLCEARLHACGATTSRAPIPPVRVKMLGKFLGRRDRKAMSRADYWRLLERSQYFPAARIEASRAAGTRPLEVIGPVR